MNKLVRSSDGGNCLTLFTFSNSTRHFCSYDGKGLFSHQIFAATNEHLSLNKEVMSDFLLKSGTCVMGVSDNVGHILKVAQILKEVQKPLLVLVREKRPRKADTKLLEVALIWTQQGRQKGPLM